MQNTWTSGKISLITFGTIIITFLFMLASINADGIVDLGAVLGMILLFVFFWLPLMITTFIMSIIAIAKNRGAKEGKIALTGVIISFVVAMGWLLMQ